MTETVQEMAKKCHWDKNKLSALLQETNPKIKMESPCLRGQIFQALINYKDTHGHAFGKAAPTPIPKIESKVSQGDPAPLPTDDTASVESGIDSNTYTPEVNVMIDEYDEFAIEQQAKQAWETNPAIRGEFNNDYDCFLAFKKAEASGRIRIAGARNVA